MFLLPWLLLLRLLDRRAGSLVLPEVGCFRFRQNSIIMLMELLAIMPERGSMQLLRNGEHLLHRAHWEAGIPHRLHVALAIRSGQSAAKR